MDTRPSRPIQKTRLRKFRLLVAEAGSAAELSRQTGIAEQYLSLIHTERRQIGDDTADRLESARGKEPGWMDMDDDLEEGNTGANDRPIRRLRLVSWSQAGRHDESMSLGEANEDAAVVYADASVSEGAFALRTRGDSMVDGAGNLSFPADSIIVVDPSIAATPGDPVVVRLQGAAEAVFKILEFDGQQYFLKPLNPRYPIAPMPSDAIILGVVVSVQIDTRTRLRR